MPFILHYVNSLDQLINILRSTHEVYLAVILEAFLLKTAILSLRGDENS